MYILRSSWPLPAQLPPSAKTEGSPVNRGLLVSQTSSKNPSPPFHVQLPGSLLWSQQTMPLQTLVDSGAHDNFIDFDLVPQAGIPTEKIEPPKDVNGRLRLSSRMFNVPNLTQVTVLQTFVCAWFCEVLGAAVGSRIKAHLSSGAQPDPKLHTSTLLVTHHVPWH